MIRRRSAGNVPECRTIVTQDHVASEHSDFASKSEINMYERNGMNISFAKARKEFDIFFSGN